MNRLTALALLPACALAWAGCAPNAIFFHESTKLGFTATYNTADSQPVSSHFGFKRRIVAVVPTQERVSSTDGNRRHDTNKGESLSLVSKFYVRAGDFNDGVVIRNNFATGEAARLLTRGDNGAASIRALLHSEAVIVNPATVSTDDVSTPAVAVENRVKEMKGRRTRPSDAPAARRVISGDPGDRNLVDVQSRMEHTATPPPATREVTDGTTEVHRVISVASPTPAASPARADRRRTGAPPSATRELTGGPGETTEIHPVMPVASPTPADSRRTSAPPSATREIDGTPGSKSRRINPEH